MDYYAHCYPHARVHRLLAALDPSGTSELILRTSNAGAPLRHLDPADITTHVRARQPADGAHLALSDQCTGTLVFDVDSSDARPLHCDCLPGGRLICDHCWVAMAGTLRGYAHLLRTHFGCSRLLACFSGGRGWHLFVLDAHHIDRHQAVHTLGQLVPDTVRHVAQSFMALNALAAGSRKFSMPLFDPLNRLSRLTDSPECTRATADRRVLELYTSVLLPYFCTVWRPRVLGCDVSDSEAVAVAGALLKAAHLGHTTASCGGCTAVRAYEQAVALNMHAEPLSVRIDAFIAIVSLLWREPDYGLLSKHHPIRLPWSPHERSGRFSLPLAIDYAHDLRPQSQPPRLAEVGRQHTTGNVWFQRSLQIVDDLLLDCERAPGVAVWPT